MKLAQPLWATPSTNSFPHPLPLRQKHLLASASVSADGPLERAGHPWTDQFLRCYAVITTDYNIARFKCQHLNQRQTKTYCPPPGGSGLRSKPPSNQERSEIVQKPYRKVFHIIRCVLITFPSVSEKGGWVLTKASSVLL